MKKWGSWFSLVHCHSFVKGDSYPAQRDAEGRGFPYFLRCSRSRGRQRLPTHQNPSGEVPGTYSWLGRDTYDSNMSQSGTAPASQEPR